MRQGVTQAEKTRWDKEMEASRHCIKETTSDRGWLRCSVSKEE